MADVRAGRAYVELGLRSKVDKGLQAVQRKLNAFGRGAALLGTSVATAGIAALTGPILAASNMEEVMGKFNTVFGDSADIIRQWSDGLAKNVGRSKRQLREFMAGAQDLFVPLGFDEQSAIEMSKTITRLTLDLASFNNMSDDAVFRDMQAALTGSGEVMKKFGVVLSEAAVKQELMNQGMDPKKATDQQKVQARLNIILRGTTAAQGDAIRTAGSFANQMRRLKAQTEDTAVTIGELFLPMATRLMGTVNRILAPIAAWIEGNKGLASTIARFFAGGVAAAGVLAAIGLGAKAAALAVGVLLTPVSLLAVGVTVAGVAAYMFRDRLANAFASVAQLFEPLLAFVRESIGGMANALISGDFSLAADIAMATWELAWISGTGRILEIWTVFGEGLITVWDTVFSTITGAFKDFLGMAFSLLDQVPGVEDYNFDFAATYYGASADAEEERQNQRRLERYKKTADTFSKINSGTSAAEAKLKKLSDKAAAENPAGLSFDAIKKKLVDITGVDLKELTNVPSADLQAPTGPKSSRGGKTAGSFSAIGAALLSAGSSNAADQTAANTAKLLAIEERKERRRQKREAVQARFT